MKILNSWIKIINEKIIIKKENFISTYYTIDNFRNIIGILRGQSTYLKVEVKQRSQRLERGETDFLRSVKEALPGHDAAIIIIMIIGIIIILKAKEIKTGAHYNLVTAPALAILDGRDIDHHPGQIE